MEIFTIINHLPPTVPMTTSLSQSRATLERRCLQNSTCHCITAPDELELSHRRRRGRDESRDIFPSSRTITPSVVLISVKDSGKIWLCRWSSKGSSIQEKRILCFEKSVWVHLMDVDGSPPRTYTHALQQIAADRSSHLEDSLFVLENVVDQEGMGVTTMHRQGVLGREVPRSRWNVANLSQSSHILALSGSPTPLLSLTLQIVKYGETRSPPSALQLACWKRRLCGTVVMHSRTKGFTTTVELPGLDPDIVQLQITSLGSRSDSHQSIFLVLPSTRVTVQQPPTEIVPQSIAPCLGATFARLPSETPQITQVLLQTLHCIRHKVSVPRSFLLSGPPGVGKTYSVKRVLELSSSPVHLVSLRGSEVLQNQANASQGLEQEFRKAAKLKENPVIIFLDECDALVSVENVAATLATLLDNLSNEWTNLLFVGATNRIDSIPGYLRRSGRLDKEIPLSPPNAKERAMILKSLLEQQQEFLGHQEVALSRVFTSVVDHVADLCVGYVPADLNALVRKATLLAKEEGPYSAVVNCIEGAMSDVAPSALRDALLTAPPKITWEDIAGDPGGAKTALRQAIEWPRTKSAVFSRLGLVAPRGILLHGPPGCAKTTLARAAAGASGVAFLSLSPAEVYSSSYVGEAEAVIRRAFSLARSAAPCVLFFDEIDSIFGGAQDGGRGSSAEARVLSTFLNEMDGVDNKSGTDGVLVLGATNRPWTLDSALVRPGRLGDKMIYIPPPDRAARRALLEMQFSRQRHTMDFDFLSSDIVTGMMTGAELVGACQEAKLEILRSVIQGTEDQLMSGSRMRDHLVSILRSRKPLLSDPAASHEYRIFEKNVTGE